MAIKRPSFLKRQKEQQRLARAQNKREARREKKRVRDEMNAAGTPAEEDGATDITAPAAEEAPDADAPTPESSNEHP